VPSATIVALVIASMEAGKHFGRITGRTGQASLRARQDLRGGLRVREQQTAGLTAPYWDSRSWKHLWRIGDRL